MAGGIVYTAGGKVKLSTASARGQCWTHTEALPSETLSIGDDNA